MTEQERILSKWDFVPDETASAQQKSTKNAMRFLAKLMWLTPHIQRKLVTFIKFNARKAALSKDEIAVLFGPNVDEWFFESILEGHPSAYAISALERLENGNYAAAQRLLCDLFSPEFDLEGLLLNWEHEWMTTNRPEAALFCYLGADRGLLQFSEEELCEMTFLIRKSYPGLDESFWDDVTH